MIRKKHSFKRVVALMATVSVLMMTGCSNGEDTKDNTEITTTADAETTTADNDTSTTVEESSTTQVESSTEETTTTQEVTTTQPPTTTQEVTTTQKKTEPVTTTQKQTEPPTTTEKQTTTQQPTTTARVEPKITASSSSMYLEDSSQISTITVTNFEGQLTFNIDNTNVVNCQWGEWNGNTIPLTFIPVGTGSTNVTVWLKGTDISVTIAVEVYKPTAADLSDLIIDTIGSEYKQYGYKSLPNINKLDDAEPIITDRINGNIDICVKIMVSCIEYQHSEDYIKIAYELFDSSGVCVESSYTLVKFTSTNQLYSDKIYFYNLAPDAYTLVFDNYY